MIVSFNNHATEVPEGTTLSQLLELKGVAAGGTATAVNGEVVSSAHRASTVLKEGDVVLVIKAVYGG